MFGENQRQKRKIEEQVKNLQNNALIEKNTSFSNDNDKYIDFNKTSRNLKKNSAKLKATKNKLENFKEKEKTYQKRPLIIDFSEMKRSGLKVLKIKNLILNFGTKEKINLEVFFGDKILISGKNGVGKTTMIKEILKSKEENNEKIIWGTNVNIGYLPQDLEFQNKNEIFINYFLKKSEKTLTDARKILNRFGFYNEEINLEINNLSPGMRARGKIALMLANNPNLLILDEPTNNIDLEILEEFEKALKNYKGTIIFVSHDEYFIEKIKPNKIINL